MGSDRGKKNEEGGRGGRGKRGERRVSELEIKEKMTQFGPAYAGAANRRGKASSPDESLLVSLSPAAAFSLSLLIIS